mgnify:CR=1 FL=1
MTSPLTYLKRAAVAGICLLAFSTTVELDAAPRPQLANRNIYANSEILLSGNVHTILPKNSILHIPEHLKSKLVQSPSGKFIIWPKFYASNPAWIYKYEVSLDQKKGNTPFTEAQIQRFEQTGKIVVAVIRNNPTSVKRINQ